MREHASSHEPVWCVLANVVETRRHGPGGVEERHGTRHFSGGTKVWVRHVFWGMGGANAEVVARHRGSKRFVVMTIRTAWLERFHSKLAYSPTVVTLLTAAPGEGGTPERGDRHLPWDGTPASKARADNWARELDVAAREDRQRALSPTSAPRSGAQD